jgi:cytochrome c-type biogenesis protein CcmH
MVCQNQTLSDSNADLAVDLRNQVKAMIEQGQSDTQIKRYMVDRYGDFVLFKPPVQANTWLLWFGPFVLLLFGALIWRRVQLSGAKVEQSGPVAKSSASSAPNAESATRPQIEAARRLLE